MFDLFRSRDTAVRYLLVVLLSLIALSMVITLIPGFGSPSMRSTETTLADVCGEAVTSRMVATVIQQQIRSKQLAPQAVDIAAPQVVNQIIGELATACEARRAGFQVSDEEVAHGIQLMLPQLFQGGQFAGKEAYQGYLSQMNLTIPEFERKVREQLLLDKLQRVAFDGIIVAPGEIDAEYQKRAEKVRLEVVSFSTENFKKEVNPTKTELEEYLKKNQAMWNVPPKRDITLMIADTDKLGAALDIPESAVRAAYDSQRDRFKVDERAKVRHILIKADEKASADEKKKAKAKAEDLLKQIKGGADFAKLAQENSDDPGSKAKGGDLDWVGRGQTVKPFEEAAFSLKPKETSGVVETIFGYHILQVLERENAHMKPYEEVKESLLSELRKRQLFERLPNLTEQTRAEIVKSPAKAEEIAKKAGLSAYTLKDVGMNMEYPVLGKSPDLDGTLAQAPKGVVTPVIQTRDNKLYFAVVNDVTPARPARLSDVEKDLRTTYVALKSRERAEQKIHDFEKKLNENGRNLEKTAKELGMKVIDTGMFERNGQMKDVGPAAYFGEQAFINPEGAVIGLYRVGSVGYYFKIVEKKRADDAGLAEMRSTLVAIVKERKLRERRDLFEEGIVRALKSEGKVKVHDDAIKRFVTAFRG